jgi:hypothetical protein
MHTQPLECEFEPVHPLFEELGNVSFVYLWLCLAFSCVKYIFCCSNLWWYKMYFIRYKACLSLLTSSLWLSQHPVDVGFQCIRTVEEMFCIVCKTSVLNNCNRIFTDDELYWCVVNSRPSVTVFDYHWKLMPFFSCV